MSIELLIVIIFGFIRFGIVSYFPGTLLVYYYLKSIKESEPKTKVSKIYVGVGLALNLFGIIITYYFYRDIGIGLWYLANLIWFSVIGIIFILYMKSKN